jgi:hypothetical protein
MKYHSDHAPSSPNRRNRVVKAITPAAAALILAACSFMPGGEAKPDTVDARVARSALDGAMPGSGHPKDDDGKVLDIEATLEQFGPKFIGHVDKKVRQLYSEGKFNGGIINAGEPAFIYEQNQLGKNVKGSVVALVDTLTYGPAILDDAGNLVGIEKDDNAQELTIFYRLGPDGDRGKAYRVDFEQSDPAMSDSGVGSVKFDFGGDEITLERYESRFKSEDPAANDALNMTLFGDGHFIVQRPESGEGIGNAVQAIENLLSVAEQRQV